MPQRHGGGGRIRNPVPSTLQGDGRIGELHLLSDDNERLRQLLALLQPGEQQLIHRIGLHLLQVARPIGAITVLHARVLVFESRLPGSEVLEHRRSLGVGRLHTQRQPVPATVEAEVLLDKISLGEDDRGVEGAVALCRVEDERVGDGAVGQGDAHVRVSDARRGVPQAEGDGASLV